MRIFELHFNPKLKEDLMFDSFCYEPENIYEKRVGSLYMVGELHNTLPQNSRFLNNIAQVIKEKYYTLPLQTPEQSFKESLKKINEFLSSEVSKENVSWLGNLNFAVLSIKPPAAFKEKWWGVNLTKVGDIKILLLRAGKIIDIGKNLDLQDIEPYPLKIFINIVSGKLDANDKIMVLTKEVFAVFAEALAEERKNRQKENKSEKSIASESLLNRLAKESSFDEKKIRDILKAKEKRLSEISGVCLFIDLSETSSEGFLEKPKIVTFQKEAEKFSMREALSPIIRLLVKLGLITKNAFSLIITLITRGLKKNLNVPVYKLKNISCFSKLRFKLETKKIKIPHLQILPIANLRKKIKITKRFKSGLISILVLSFILLIGFLIFQREEKQQLEKQKAALNEVQEKVEQAKNLLIFEEEKANILFKESWEEILPLTEKDGELKNKAVYLKEFIEEQLKNINKLEKVDNPKIIFEFNQEEFIPQKMVIFQKELYFFNPYSQNLFKTNEAGESGFFQTNQKFNLANSINDAILLFSRPDKITAFKNSQFDESLSLKQPYPAFNFIDFSSFRENLYFLDSEKGEIIKYAAPIEKWKESPQLWLDPKSKKATDGKSIAVDGSIWILKENNTISLYYNGQYQKDLILDFFPYPKKLYKIIILPNLPRLYILEPIQKRIIILDKAGRVTKQFQSEKFDNLKDFAVSGDGKIIYLLNGLKVYQITAE